MFITLKESLMLDFGPSSFFEYVMLIFKSSFCHLWMLRFFKIIQFQSHHDFLVVKDISLYTRGRCKTLLSLSGRIFFGKFNSMLNECCIKELYIFKFFIFFFHNIWVVRIFLLTYFLHPLHRPTRINFVES